MQEDTKQDQRPTSPLPPPQEVFNKHVTGKRLAYLDTSAWIELAQARTTVAQECLQACREAKRAGTVLFPLSYASIKELLAGGEEEERRALLMEELSDGVTFRKQGKVIEVEARAAMPLCFGRPAKAPDCSLLFTYSFGCINEEIAFPTWFLTKRQDITRIAFMAHSARSLVWLLANWKSAEESAHHTSIDSTHTNDLANANTQAANATKNKDGSLNKRKVLLQEQNEFFEISIRPTLLDAIPSSTTGEKFDPRFALLLQQGRDDRGRTISALIEAMPAADHWCRFMAARVMNPSRKVIIPNDFWDNEHAQVAPAYVHAFVTLDRGLVDLLRQCGSQSTSRYKLLAQLDALLHWLQET